MDRTSTAIVVRDYRPTDVDALMAETVGRLGKLGLKF